MASAVLSAAAAPATIPGLIKSGANSNGNNSASWTFTDGAPGAGNLISNADLQKGVSTTSRLGILFNTVFTDIVAGATAQQQLDAAVAALGLAYSGYGIDQLRLVVVSGNKLSATATTSQAAGHLRISLAASISA